MGENICKQYNWQGVNIQNTQTAHTPQYWKSYNPIKKCEEDLKRHFATKNMQIANGHMKRCLTCLIIKQMQIKTTIRCHFPSVRMAIIKKPTNNQYWRGCGKKDIFVYFWWECKLV